MSHGRGGGLVDHIAVAKTLDREGRVDRMWLVARDGVRAKMRGTGSRLEPAGAPAAIDVESWHRRLGDDRRALGRHLAEAAPTAPQPHSADTGTASVRGSGF